MRTTACSCSRPGSTSTSRSRRSGSCSCLRAVAGRLVGRLAVRVGRARSRPPGTVALRAAVFARFARGLAAPASVPQCARAGATCSAGLGRALGTELAVVAARRSSWRRRTAGSSPLPRLRGRRSWRRHQGEPGSGARTRATGSRVAVRAQRRGRAGSARPLRACAAQWRPAKPSATNARGAHAKPQVAWAAPGPPSVTRRVLSLPTERRAPPPSSDRATSRARSPSSPRGRSAC